MGQVVWRQVKKFAIGTRHFPQDVLYSKKSRARSSVDRASGSGPEGRGFKSLRAHLNLSKNWVENPVLLGVLCVRMALPSG